jgi:hypothetical protein
VLQHHFVDYVYVLGVYPYRTVQAVMMWISERPEFHIEDPREEL